MCDGKCHCREVDSTQWGERWGKISALDWLRQCGLKFRFSKFRFTSWCLDGMSGSSWVLKPKVSCLWPAFNRFHSTMTGDYQANHGLCDLPSLAGRAAWLEGKSSFISVSFEYTEVL